MNKKKILATLVMLSLMHGSVYATEETTFNEFDKYNMVLLSEDRTYDCSININNPLYTETNHGPEGVEKENFDNYNFNEMSIYVYSYKDSSHLTLNKDLSIVMTPPKYIGQKYEDGFEGINISHGSVMKVAGDTSIEVNAYKSLPDMGEVEIPEDSTEYTDPHRGIVLGDVDIAEDQGINQVAKLELGGDLDITLNDGSRGIGILATKESELDVKGDTTIKVLGSNLISYGISNNKYGPGSYSLKPKNDADDARLHFYGDLDITTNAGYSSIGIMIADPSDSLNSQGENSIIVDGHTKISATGAKNDSAGFNPDSIGLPEAAANYGIFLNQIKSSAFNTAEINTTSDEVDVESIGTYMYWHSNAVFNGDVSYDTKAVDGGVAISALARAGSSIDFKEGLKANGKVVLNASGNKWNEGSKITVNSNKNTNAIVQLNGDIVVGKTNTAEIWGSEYDTTLDSTETENIITANLLNDNSYFTGVNEFGNEGSEINLTFDNGADWNMTDSTTVTDLVLANGADLNVNYDKANSTDYRTLTAENFTGEGGIVNLDIDASTNINNSDRIFVNGTHKDTHYITLNNVGANTDGAEGTVLVSVNDEQGKFEANDSEGALYWNRYDLDSKESTTDGYNTDWYLKEVEQLDEPTTSVDTILGANALGYHTWRAETDKLMKRMGDLRHNGEDEKGAWFRVRGAEISRDGEASFENKYTVYELGYDEMTKKTDRFTRYQGAALSYIDGTSSFARGSGENDGKSIAFYTTEMRNKGHYLDLVFRIADMDSDYKVYDTNGNKITGEPENVGVSLSAEYGRKKVMDDNGWYIEPQGQLTVGYFGGDNYRAKYADQYIDVHQSGIPSVLGRIGFNIGRDIDENTNIYLKANLLHEFCGDYDVDMVDSAGNRRTESDTFNDTWFEYGIGAAIKTGKNNHLYFDFEKTAGGDFEKDWAWNAGMRWTF